MGPQQTVNIDNGAKVKLGHSDNVFTFSAQLVNTNVSTPKRTGVIKRLSKSTHLDQIMVHLYLKIIW